jgi:hypothetical protein
VVNEAFCSKEFLHVGFIRTFTKGKPDTVCLILFEARVPQRYFLLIVQPILIMLACICVLSANFAHTLVAQEQAKIKAEFRNPGKQYRPMVRWWWPGTDVTDKEIGREVGLLDASGFGGTEIQPFVTFDPHAMPPEEAEHLDGQQKAGTRGDPAQVARHESTCFSLGDGELAVSSCALLQGHEPSRLAPSFTSRCSAVQTPLPANVFPILLRTWIQICLR